MTSSSEEDASRGVEGLDAAGGRSESVTYPRFLLVGMTSASDSSSSLTGVAGTGLIASDVRGRAWTGASPLRWAAASWRALTSPEASSTASGGGMADGVKS